MKTMDGTKLTPHLMPPYPPKVMGYCSLWEPWDVFLRIVSIKVNEYISKSNRPRIPSRSYGHQAIPRSLMISSFRLKLAALKNVFSLSISLILVPCIPSFHPTYVTDPDLLL